MEDNLNIYKGEYLSNHWLDLSLSETNDWIFLEFSLVDPSESKTWMKWRRPTMEDDLKILKVEYLSNRLLDLTQILNFSYMTKPCFVNPSNEDNLQWKTISKYQKWNISATVFWIILKF